MSDKTLSLQVGKTLLTADYVGPNYYQVFENGRFVRNLNNSRQVRRFFRQRAKHLANPCNHYVDNQGLCHECGKPMDKEKYISYAGDTASARRLWGQLVAIWNTANKHDPTTEF